MANPRVADDETIPPGVNLDALHGFFVANVPGSDAARPLQATLLVGGSSNLTYLVTDGRTEWVLRRPPLGHVLPTAHDMGREFRIQRALAGSAVPVPRMDAYCDDPAVNGEPFYVMERLHGNVYQSAGDVTHLDKNQALAAGERLIDVLAALHTIDFEAVGLGDFGRPEGYLARQIRRWSEQWQRSKSREITEIDDLIVRLNRWIPTSPPATIVHGDYSFNNTMYALDDPTRMVAVLDWEMSTLGDPLTDLALLVLYWDKDRHGLTWRAQPSPTIGDRGFFSVDALVARYERASGVPVADLDYYLVFAHYKMAVILEGIYARYQQGKTLNINGPAIGAAVLGLARRAIDLADASGRRSLSAHG